MENEFTQFYKEHNISPVSQDLSDINLHLKRRANLYQILGIDKRLFKNRDVLEVGPGSGFNSICFCKWGANLDLVEPNDKGRKEISQNLNGYKFRLYDDFIESFVSDKKYDFVIAEGFLPSLNNSKDILCSLIKFLKKDGILVTTCIDEFSHFYEDLRRITGFILISNLKYFDEKVQILCKAFKSHLNSLKFASRPIKDWVSDVVLNPVNDNKFLSIKNYITMIDKITNGGGMELIAVNPCLVSNLSWYKDMDYSYKNEFKNKFDRKKHILLDTSWDDFDREIDKNDRLQKELLEFRQAIRIYKLGECKIDKIVKILTKICNNNADLPVNFIKCIKEVLELLNKDFSWEDLSNAENFRTSWGRGQQYVSFRRSL
ncbi:class I SAM-dependent methyltransferase [Campylobacter fetus]|uniref:class I SAM-dependent methyltransferase n=2 Tax=Campylobacter fetus TaxID=196 RepID=UPI000818C5D1|nr:methyltransferase domain-containing protein [Campylobacter fetus]OCR92406.1 hypothetical protein CFT12S02263_06315 [Campylobacter fetus subsp. testudinum]